MAWSNLLSQKKRRPPEQYSGSSYTQEDRESGMYHIHGLFTGVGLGQSNEYCKIILKRIVNHLFFSQFIKNNNIYIHIYICLHIVASRKCVHVPFSVTLLSGNKHYLGLVCK
jgi:hypothetical protein